MKRILGLLLIVLTLGAVSLRAEEIVGLTASNKLIRFDSATPGTITTTVQITGLQSGENIVGMDFRPATGQLFGVGSTSRIYNIDVTTGVATVVGTSPFTPVLSGVRFGVDFNPTVDRIRLVSDNNQNQRYNPDTGATAGNDTNLAYAPLDSGFGKTPRVVSAAYSNNVSISSNTTLYAIDSNLDTLVTVGSFNSNISPNGGQLFTVGSLGIDVTDTAGFDISGQTGTAYAALMLNGAATHQLYTLNLSTGTAISHGDIAAGELLIDIAVVAAPTPFDMVALRTNGTLIRFDSRTPSVVTTGITVTGLQNSEVLRGIDYRPANGVLYGVASSATTSRVYSIDPVTGVATAIGGVLNPQPTNFAIGLDFNPVVDRIRFVNEANQNLRLNPDTGGIAATDTNLAYAAGDVNFGKTPDIVALAYTNNVAGATSTVLFGIDPTLNILVTINPPNSGTVNTVATLSTAVNGTNIGFDINAAGVAFLNASNTLYTLNLTTGAMTPVGTATIGGGTGIVDVTFVTQPTTSVLQLSAASYSVVEGSTASIIVQRSASSSGVVSVDYIVNSGTAVAGTDFTASKGTLTFLNGETSRTIFVNSLNNKTLSPFLNATVVLSNPVGATLGAQTSATLVIADINDLDGDGFTNETETAAATDPLNAAVTPFGTAPAGVLQPLTVDKVSIKLNFVKPTLNDSVAFSGTIPNALTAIPAGTKFTIEAGFVNGKGGVAQVFTLDEKGKSTPKGLTLAKPKSGLSKYSVSLTKGTFAAQLLAAGFVNENKSKSPLKVQFNVYFNNVSYTATKDTDYTATKGKSSSDVLTKVK